MEIFIRYLQNEAEGNQLPAAVDVVPQVGVVFRAEVCAEELAEAPGADHHVAAVVLEAEEGAEEAVVVVNKSALYENSRTEQHVACKYLLLCCIALYFLLSYRLIDWF
jgi:hypothetical protein